MWVVIAIAIYFLFFRETTTIEFEDGVQSDPSIEPNYGGEPSARMGDPRSPIYNTGNKKCSGRKCKAVRRKGFLGIGRQVAKDWCKYTGSSSIPCACLGNVCS